MEQLFAVYKDLHDLGVRLTNKNLGFSDGCPAALLEIGSRYGVYIDTGLIHTLGEELEVAAHEWAHIVTGTTHHVNDSDEQIRKDEQKAIRAMIRRLIPKDELGRLVKRGYNEVWELAEYFDVSFTFMQKAIEYYRIE